MVTGPLSRPLRSAEGCPYCECPALHEDIAARAAPGAEVLVVAPALNSRVRHWVSDSDAGELRRRGDPAFDASPGRSHWLEKGLVEQAQERFEQRVTHLVSGYGLAPTPAVDVGGD